MAIVQYDTDNSTGFTAYVSSIDEDTNLNHVDSSVTQKITSITAPGGAATFSSKNWGYLANQTTTSATSFNPIPKASQPDQAFSISHPETAKFFLHFGVKTGPDLPSGTYFKKILVTAVTNYVPTSATFLTGPVVNDIIRNVNTGHDVEFFKKAAAAPPLVLMQKLYLLQILTSQSIFGMTKLQEPSFGGVMPIRFTLMKIQIICLRISMITPL